MLFTKRFSFFLCVLSALCGSLSAQDYKTVADGVEYAEMTRTIAGQPVRMNLLRLDLTKTRLDVVHAMDAAIGTETVSSIAKRHGAYAAINAGFFRLDTSIWAGDSAGTLIVDRKFLSESDKPRVELFIGNGGGRTSVQMGRGPLHVSLWFGKKLSDPMPSARLNCERLENDLVLYTPEFGRTTLTSPGGLELIVRKDQIVQILDSTGSSKIPSDGYVISASGSRREALLRIVKPRMRVGPMYRFDAAQMEDLEDAVAGVPQLINDGQIDITWQEEKTSKSFVETGHPRTAVAKLKDGKFLMITVDGRSESSGGIGLPDLAQLILELGATDAMNLDGGGSTTMYLDGKVVNQPSDKEGERKVSDAILVTLRRPRQRHDR
jgi:exopolysaccharide biosynthesis protein